MTHGQRCEARHGTASGRVLGTGFERFREHAHNPSEELVHHLGKANRTLDVQVLPVSPVHFAWSGWPTTAMRCLSATMTALSTSERTAWPADPTTTPARYHWNDLLRQYASWAAPWSSRGTPAACL